VSYKHTIRSRFSHDSLKNFGLKPMTLIVTIRNIIFFMIMDNVIPVNKSIHQNYPGEDEKHGEVHVKTFLMKKP